jgi:hypothetical protein
MWIVPEIIPALIDAVQTAITESVAVLDNEDWTRNDGYDPNDLMILDGFVLTTLKENIQFGFFASEMLDKGFSFMMGMVPAYLREKGEQLAPKVFGELARLHLQYALKTALARVQSLDAEYLRENLSTINREIDWARLDISRQGT